MEKSWSFDFHLFCLDYFEGRFLLKHKILLSGLSRRKYEEIRDDHHTVVDAGL